jgi:hypothetical protein
MKKIIYLSAIMILITSVSMAQNTNSAQAPITIETTPYNEPNLYPETSGTITKSNYTYKYRNKKRGDFEIEDRVELYNAANSFVDVEWKYKDGTPVPFINEEKDQPPVFTDSSQSVRETLDMVAGCFTDRQREMLSGSSVFITVLFSSSTGVIKDVYFDFFRNGPFKSIPVETYRSVELALKQNLKLYVTEEGEKLNYIQLFWSQGF